VKYITGYSVITELNKHLVKETLITVLVAGFLYCLSENDVYDEILLIGQPTPEVKVGYHFPIN
jgi:hypothetical protein